MNIRQSIAKSLAIAVTTITLVACGGGSDEGGTTSAGTTTTGSATTAASPLAPDFPNLRACVTNVWSMSGDQGTRIFTALGAGSSGVNITSGGQAILELKADGTYKWTPNITYQFSGALTGSGTSSGTQTGTWSIDGDNLISQKTSSTVATTVTLLGTTTTYADTGTAANPRKIIACTPATLTYDETLPNGNVARIVLVTG